MMLKYVPAFVFLIAAGPVLAQGATQTPPAPNSATSSGQTSNSLPAGAANMNLNSTQNPNLAGQAIGGSTTNSTAPAPTTGTAAPMRP